MATRVQQRRGTTAEHATFTGAVGEVTVDTDKDTAVVHDGTTAGGRPLMRQDMSNVPAGTVTSTMIADGTIVNADVNASAAIAGTKISPDFGSQTIASTGLFSHALGTAGAPTITFTGDPNTGIYSPGADQVAISTNGTGRLFVTSNGDIGINQSSVTAIYGTTISATNTALGGATYRVAGFTTSAYLFTSDGLGYGGILQASAHPLIFGTSSAERMRLDTSGRLGLGSSSPDALLTVNGIGAFGAGAVTTPSIAATGDLNTGFWFPAADTIAASTGGSERFRCDSSGRLLVGTSSGQGDSLLQIKGQSNSSTGVGSIFLQRGLSIATISTAGNVDLAKIEFGNQDGAIGAVIQANADAAWGTNDYPSRLTFSTTADGASSPTERMRITQQGQIFITSTTDAIDSTSFGTRIGGADAPGRFVSSRNVDGTLPVAQFFGNAGQFLTRGDGDAENTNNSYGAISDIKLKENIVNASSQWNDLKALQVRKYNFKAETGYNTHTQIGLIAQEVELICPGLVGESIDEETGESTKSVNYSVLYMKAVKALQEAMERIEQLETEMAAVKAQLS